jgi:hypothetical protein
MRERPAISPLKESENLSCDPSPLDEQEEHSVANGENDRKIDDPCPDANANLPRRAAEPGVCSTRHHQSLLGSHLLREASATDIKMMRFGRLGDVP